MQPLNWNDLRDFLIVARTRQLARAAKSLGVDATTVSRRLRRLERRMGQALFEQTRDGHLLTEAGARLLARLEAMDHAAQSVAEPLGSDCGHSGLIRVSVSEGFGTWFVAQHLHAFLALHPNVSVDLVATNGFLSPSRRETDIAVLLARPRSGPVTAGKLSDYKLRFYVARHYRPPLPQEAGDLNVHRLIGYVPEFLYAKELDYLSDASRDLAATVRSTSINAQHQLVRSGAGVGVLPCFIADRDEALQPVLPDITITRSFWIVTHKETRQLGRLRAFRTWLAETTRAHRAELMGSEAA